MARDGARGGFLEKMWFPKQMRSNSLGVLVASSAPPPAALAPSLPASSPAARGRRVWEGNWNAYWVGGTALGLWFLFVYTPLHPPRLDALFLTHLIAAGGVYLICMWNTFHTPSHGVGYAAVHRWLGRTAIPLGVVGYGAGLIVAWPAGRAPLGLAIGLTIGGAMQMATTLLGAYFVYRAKRAEGEARARYVRYHALAMCGLFLPSCGTPAAMRLAGLLGMPFGVGLPLFTVLLIAAIVPMQRAIFAGRWC